MPVFEFSKDNFKNISCKNGGNAELSDEHSKLGGQSLKWDFSNGSKLCIKAQIGFEPFDGNKYDQKRHAFGVYIYCPSCYDGGLKFEFFKRGKVICSFNAKLGFIGWRCLWALFERDMEGVPQSGMDELIITASGIGTLFMDELVTSNRIDSRHVIQSYQIPQIKNNYLSFSDMEECGKQSHKTANPEFICRLDKAVEQHICSRLKEFCLNEFAKGVTTKEQLLSKVKELGIDNGKRVEFAHQRLIVAGTPFEETEYTDLRLYNDTMRSVALAYVKTGDNEYKDIYLKMLRYIMEQGLAEGSSMGTHAILDYSLRSFYTGAFLMMEQIKSAGLDEQVLALMIWFSGLRRWGMLNAEDVGLEPTADTFNNISQGMLITILMMNDDIEKGTWLKAYCAWLSRKMRHTPGLMGMFKPDGSIYHHCGHYTAYGMGALTGLAPLLYAISGTEFDIDDIAWANMKKVMLAMRFYCNKYHYPIALSGRHPTGTWKIELVPYKYFALAALERGDSEPVAVYLRLMREPKDGLDKRLADSGIIAERDPQGHLTMNRACASFHRRGKWVAVVKGFSRYLWGNETYIANNLYGRYISYGYLQIIHRGDPVDLEHSGFTHNGFDWNRFPGATYIYLPFPELKERVYNLDSMSGFEEMLISDESFAGGVSLRDNGMFALKLHEHPKYNGTHRAIKTVYFIDDFILLLGSDIENISNYQTETCLFQNAVAEDDPPVTVNGRAIEGRYEFITSEGDILSDNKGNTYYLKQGQKVFISQGLQTTPASTNSEPTQGRYAVASILHGVSPKGQEYEYGVGIEGAKPKTYTVLQKDKVAHAAVIDGILCCAVFEPDKFCGIKDILSVSRPVMLMLQSLNGSTILSVCDPDLGLYDKDPSQYDENGNRIEVSIYSRSWIKNPVGKNKVKIILKGSYSTPDAEYEQVNGNTIISLELEGGTPFELKLNR